MHSGMVPPPRPRRDHTHRPDRCQRRLFLRAGGEARWRGLSTAAAAPREPSRLRSMTGAIRRCASIWRTSSCGCTRRPRSSPSVDTSGQIHAPGASSAGTSRSETTPGSPHPDPSFADSHTRADRGRRTDHSARRPGILPSPTCDPRAELGRFGGPGCPVGRLPDAGAVGYDRRGYRAALTAPGNDAGCSSRRTWVNPPHALQPATVRADPHPRHRRVSIAWLPLVTIPQMLGGN